MSDQANSKVKYSPMTSRQDVSSLSQDDPNSQSLMANDNKDEMTIKRIRSLKDLYHWFMKDPCSRWQVLFFLGIFILSLILVVVAAVDPSSSYATSGIAGLIVAGYGAFHFKTLMALREEVDEFERHNTQFKRENAQMRVELDKLSKTKEELESASAGLIESTKKSKENLEKFQKISHNLELMGESNMEGVTRVAEMTKTIAKKWKEELIATERQLFMDVFERLETKDGDEDMTYDEYNGFLDQLPPKYRMRLQHQHSFQTLAGDDNKISYQEFSDLLDQMARNFASTSNNSRASGGDATATGNGVSGIVEE